MAKEAGNPPVFVDGKACTEANARENALRKSSARVDTVNPKWSYTAFPKASLIEFAAACEQDAASMSILSSLVLDHDGIL